LGHLNRYPHNNTSSPDLPRVAGAIRDMPLATGLGDIDGVIVMDPIALAALLRLTGPITVDWWPEPISADNAEQVLLVEQYRDAHDPARVDFLESIARAVFDRIKAGDLTTPSDIADVMSPQIAQKHLRMYAFDPEVNGFLESIGTGEHLPVPVGDALGVVTSDRTPSKLDAFLERRVDYDVTIDPATGVTSAIARITYVNHASSDLPANGYFGDPPGRNELVASLYTALSMEWADFDGAAVGLDVSSERGHNVYDADVEVAPQSESTLSFGLSGTLPVIGGHYHLDVHRQPTVAPDQLRVRVNGDVVFDGPQDRDVVVDVRL
jgi:hypothetical protein